MDNKENGSSIPPQPQLSLEERFNLIRGLGEECIQDDELRSLLANKSQIICYDGFEPSGRMHIAQGVMKAINVKKLTSSGCTVKIWIADKFAQMNNKMGGDLDKIKVVGKYLIEIWKALGMDIDGGRVQFLWASDEISSRPDKYWDLVLKIAMRSTLRRIQRYRCRFSLFTLSDKSFEIISEAENPIALRFLLQLLCLHRRWRLYFI